MLQAMPAAPVAQELVKRVWGYDDAKDTDLPRGLVRTLAAKVETDPRRPVYLVTHPGVGDVCLPEGAEPA